jgi:hypothetical protein
VSAIVSRTQKMDAKFITRTIADALARVGFDQVPPNTTVGSPWSEEQRAECRARLVQALVEPCLQRFELRETYEQITSTTHSTALYWVVAESGDHLEWFDPATGEFGLGQHVPGCALPIAIGVRGDPVGVFCAI